MDVICLLDRHQPGSGDQAGSECNNDYIAGSQAGGSNVHSSGRQAGSGAVPCRGSAPCTHDDKPALHDKAALFPDFREEEVDVRQLAARLRAAGLEQHWTAATGLPPPPAA